MFLIQLISQHPQESQKIILQEGYGLGSSSLQQPRPESIQFHQKIMQQ